MNLHCPEFFWYHTTPRYKTLFFYCSAWAVHYQPPTEVPFVKTYVPGEGAIKKQWRLIDADGKSLGRVAAEAASLLRGKHKPDYTPFLDCGDPVIIINAAKVQITGDKMQQKKYYRHSGYPGGIKETRLDTLMRKHPTRALEFAVKGMLPGNRLGRKLARQFRIYAGADHPHAAQAPVPHEVK